MNDTGNELAEYLLIISQLCDFVHLRARRPPWIVGGCISDFGLGIRVALCVVFCNSQRTFDKLLHEPIIIFPCLCVIMKAASGPPAHNAALPVQNAPRSSRIAPHSHIKGLGLSPQGLAVADAAGFIGQTNAREVRFFSVISSLTRSSGLWCRCGSYKVA